MIKEFVARGSKSDDISDVIGSDAYWMRYYFDELKDRCLGPYSKDNVGVSRFYPMTEQTTPDGSKRTPVVVDFEPPPKTIPMFLEEKMKFFMEKGIVYVPVYLPDQLTKEEFARRFEQAQEVLIKGYREELENEALESVDIPMFSETTLMAEVDALALERVTQLGLRGAAKNKRLVKEKKEILEQKLAERQANGVAGGGRTSSLQTTTR